MLAVAAGALISPALMAADVEGPSLSAYVSDEYLSTSPSTEVFGHFQVGFTIEAEYAVGDIVTLSFSGDALDETTLPSSVVSTGSPATVTLGLLSADSGSAVYRVTEVNTGGGNSTVGATFALCAAAPDTCDFNANAIDANNGVVMAFSAETGTGLPLDTGGGADRSTALFVTGSQFAASVTTSFDGVVDVNDNRESFTTGTFDSATFNVDSNAQSCGGVDDPCEAALAQANPVDQDVTLASDFSWVFDSDANTAGLQPAAGVFTLGNCGGPTAYSATAITTTCGFGASNVDIDVAPNATAAAAAVVLPATSFVSTHVLNYEGSGGTASSITVTNLGAWTLNGFQAKVAYMPFQTGISQVIYIANRSDQDGAITIDWIDQNGNSDSFDIGIVNAGSTRAIGPAIQAGLPEAQQEGGRLALTITANVPACDAQLNAQYNVSGDRAFSVATNNCPVETAHD
jgi:hypothetical protein